MVDRGRTWARAARFASALWGVLGVVVPVDVRAEVGADPGRPPIVYAIDPSTGQPILDFELATRLFGAATPPPLRATGGQIQMNKVASLSTSSSILLSSPKGFDVDHDGRREFVLKWLTPALNGVFEFYENAADDTFELVHTLVVNVGGGGTALPMDVGDADGDGLDELVVAGHFPSNVYAVQLYESKSPMTYPTERVWSATGGGFFRGARIADTDGDGTQEIVVGGKVSSTQQRIVVYENDGPDSYSLTYYQDLSEIQSSQCMDVARDLDGDGHDEILFGGLTGSGSKLFMVENVGDNAYEVVWSFIPLYQGVHLNLTVLKDCGDLDGDGKKEFLLGGLKPISQPGQTVNLVLLLLEATGNNEFGVVTVFSQPYGSLSSSEDANLADVDGDGKREVVFGSGNTLRIYRNIGDNAWEEIWSTATGNMHSIGAGDHDADGKDEIITQGTSGTEIWEINQAYASDPDSDGRVTAVDNCPWVANPGQENVDGDPAGNLCDCAPGDGTAFALPGDVAGMRIQGNKATLVWGSLEGSAGSGTVYDVIRGSVTGLPVGSTTMSCLESDSADTTADDASPLAVGKGFFYLTRGTNACGVGTYGADSSGSQQMSTACP